MRHHLASFAVSLALVLISGWGTAGASPAQAGGSVGCDQSVALDEVLRDLEPGSTVVLATYDVAAADRGRHTDLVLTPRNNESIHPDNDLVVSTGGQSMTFADVERENPTVERRGPIGLGDTMTVSLVVGPDGTWSAGFELTLECAAAQPTTTTTAPTTTVPPTTAPPPPAPPAAPAPPSGSPGRVPVAPANPAAPVQVPDLAFTGLNETLLWLAGGLIAAGALCIALSARRLRSCAG